MLCVGFCSSGGGRVIPGRLTSSPGLVCIAMLCFVELAHTQGGGGGVGVDHLGLQSAHFKRSGALRNGWSLMVTSG